MKVVLIDAGGEEVFDVGELTFALRLAGPVELGEDEVFFADDPERAASDMDSLAAFELDLAVFLALADHEVDFDEAFVMDDVKGRLLEDGLAGGFFAVVEVIAEKLGEGFEIFEVEGEDDIDVSCHSRLGVMIQGHGAGEHVVQSHLLQAAGDVQEEVEF